MDIRWTRAALDARLEALEQKHSGKELVDAVVSFADLLTDEDRRLLQDVLLERARRQAREEERQYWPSAARWRRFFGYGLGPRRRSR